MDRFWSKTRKVDSGCIEWQGAIRRGGYGAFGFQGKTMGAHRVAFFLENGYFPSLVRHTCDNRRCVNPAHLLPGTHADNMRDCIERGRFPDPPKGRTTEEVKSRIRSMRARGMKFQDIADELGIAVSTAWRFSH